MHENELFLAKKRDNAKSKTVKPAAARLHLFRKRLIFNTFSKTTFSYRRATGKKVRVTAIFCQKVQLFLQKAPRVIPKVRKEGQSRRLRPAGTRIAA